MSKALEILEITNKLADISSDLENYESDLEEIGHDCEVLANRIKLVPTDEVIINDLHHDVAQIANDLATVIEKLKKIDFPNR